MCSGTVDDECRVRGYENLYACNALFPDDPAREAHMPTLALAEKLGSQL
jgi:choline dehydrogenase-like flavoprotein